MASPWGAPTAASVAESGPVLSVIVPAYNCPDVLAQSLAALVASDLPRDRWELLVVDDGSTDHTGDVARRVADQVLRNPHGPQGPGTARNIGAARARTGLLLFVDADVLVAPNTLSGFVALFDANPDVVSAFGAYDDAPAVSDFLSQYRNLLHHYVHTMSRGDATTFWAGCGAVRRKEFLSVGGFDPVRYPRPQIEDIELGYRLSDAGHRIRLVPELQGKHLKRWRFGNMIRTDLRDRAIPWMQLVLERRQTAADGPLNLQAKEKVLTALSGVMLGALVLSLATGNGAWLTVFMLCAAAIVVGNAAMLRWFARIRGPWFALRVVPLRMLFYILSGIGAAWAILTYRGRPMPAPRPPLRDHRDQVVAS